MRIIKSLWRWTFRLFALAGFLIISLAIVAALAYRYRNIDNINRPFVDDPQAVGWWTSVDFVRSPDDFSPQLRHWTGELSFKSLEICPNGKTDREYVTWTRGAVLNHDDDHTACSYEIRRIDGVRYLFYQCKNGDYIYLHKTPSYYVMRYSGPPGQRIVDNINLSFANDPDVLGRWKSVDFVQLKSEFSPDAQHWNGGLYLQSLAFYPNGSVCWIAPPDQSYCCKWTKGSVLNSGSQTAPAYELRWIGGQKYMFFEWKSGDYTERHCLPGYYVLKWSSDAPAMNATPSTGALSDATTAKLHDWVDDFFHHNWHDITVRTTLEWGQPEKTASGDWAIRYKCKATIWDRDNYLMNMVFIFRSDGMLINVDNMAGFPKALGRIPPVTRPAVPDSEIEPALHDWVEKFFTRNEYDITNRQTVQWGKPKKLSDGNWQIDYRFTATLVWTGERFMYDQLFTFTPSGDYVSVKNKWWPLSPAGTTRPSAHTPATRSTLYDEAREKCANNLKQIGLLVMTYAAANNSQLPPNLAAAARTADDYHVALFVCPSSATTIPLKWDSMSADQKEDLINTKSDYIYLEQFAS